MSGFNYAPTAFTLLVIERPGGNLSLALWVADFQKLFQIQPGYKTLSSSPITVGGQPGELFRFNAAGTTSQGSDFIAEDDVAVTLQKGHIFILGAAGPTNRFYPDTFKHFMSTFVAGPKAASVPSSSALGWSRSWRTACDKYVTSFQVGASQTSVDTLLKMALLGPPNVNDPLQGEIWHLVTESINGASVQPLDETTQSRMLLLKTDCIQMNELPPTTPGAL